MATTGKPCYYVIGRPKIGRTASCQNCGKSCLLGALRIGSSPTSPGKIRNWFHVNCALDHLRKQQVSVDSIDGWNEISTSEQESIKEQFADTALLKPMTVSMNSKMKPNKISDDNRFVEFQRICARLANESSYLAKTAILNSFFQKGCNGKHFDGSILVWVKMLLPNADKRIYNLQSIQLIKLFARIFAVDQAEMVAHLEQGDVSETIREFFERSKVVKPLANSALTLFEVDAFLNKLATLSKEDEQTTAFRELCRNSTANDLKMVIRIIKRDIRIHSGAKHVLAALSKDAYAAYQSSKDLEEVVNRFAGSSVVKVSGSTDKTTKARTKRSSSSGGIQLMSPISPMLADACKSVEQAIAKCPDGMYSEIKYDGERIQLHKQGSSFRFFTRNLKPVAEHKIKRCEQFVPKAFPNASDLILDSEILMVDTQTGEQLPFGTLGKHKKTAFDSAEVCLFVFDCIFYNGEDLTKKTLKERRKILEEIMTPIKNHVQLSECHVIQNPRQLKLMISKVLQSGLEGLVLKNVNGLYEPGKRHWLKVKKDYLFEGQMADSADLVVLGASFGTGKKGSLLSIFLMGCWDGYARRWKTVTKVHTGFDDKTLNEMHNTLTPLLERCDPNAVPDWLICTNALLPKMVAKDPTKMPVWEITGAEFSSSDRHTADGISIRFPRITKQRSDKSWKEATSLSDLSRLYESSKSGEKLGTLYDALESNDGSTADDIQIDTKIQQTSPKRKRANVSPVAGRETKKPKLSETVVRAPKNGTSDSTESTSSAASASARRSKHKINYAFNDSSDEDNTTIAAVVPAAAALQPIKPEKKAMQEVGKKACDVTTTKTDCQANAASNAGDNPTDAPNNEHDDVGGSTNWRRANQNATTQDVTIFEGVRLYVPADVRDRVKEELRYFRLWGGEVLSDALRCSHVLHANAQLKADWLTVRKTYAARSRHVQLDWLVESVKTRSLVAVESYPVTLVSLL